MKKYRIKKGKHSSGFHLGITFKKTIKFICFFDSSCLYNIEGQDKYDINKLFGFSTTWYHHKQSGRIGWRCVDGEKIQIITYSYNDSHRDMDDSNIIGEVYPNQKFTCTIKDLENVYEYTFKFNDSDSVVKNFDNKKPDWFIFNYLLYPYFGGNKTSPHDMCIFLDKL